ncbi:MAG: amidase [Minwuia sp.]|uniref:amidase n=1 Tax=Minwuia sp. TaxID=2493630 RepID=UPI003A88E6BC
MEDTVGAFCGHGKFVLRGATDGPLAGMTFAVKDLIDVEGIPTGAGSPAWLASHPVPDHSASCVRKLLDAGATAIGKSITDELAYSINGDNIHYGTPVNPRAPGRTPGGSSSGSAAAVAAGLRDFALATDTGGSTRVPASYCGLFGLRTTHGAIPMDGIVPLMPGFDTLTWLARDSATFAAVGDVLLPQSQPEAHRGLVLLEDAMAELDIPGREAFKEAITGIEAQHGPIRRLTISDHGLESWRQIYLALSAAEAWEQHGEWIEKTRPGFSPAIAARFDIAREMASRDLSPERAARTAIARGLDAILAEGDVALLPSAAGPAIPLNASPAEIEAMRQRTFRMTCIAGLGGLPQVSIPGIEIGGLPVGLSLIGRRGSDRALIALGGAMAQLLAGRQPAAAP